LEDNIIYIIVKFKVCIILIFNKGQEAKAMERVVFDWQENNFKLIHYYINSVRVIKKKRVKETESIMHVSVHANKGCCNLVIKDGIHDVTGFNFYEQLKSGLSKVKANKKTTEDEEHAIEALWHELLHIQAKKPAPDLFSEIINEWVARHTYEEFIKQINPNAKAYHKKYMLDLEQIGEDHFLLEKFMYMLQLLGINEKRFLKKVKPLLLDDYYKLEDRVMKLIAKTTGISYTNATILIEKVKSRRQQRWDIKSFVDKIKPEINKEKTSAKRQKKAKNSKSKKAVLV